MLNFKSSDSRRTKIQELSYPAVNWGVKNAMVINYTSSHDNHTLWDKLAVSRPEASEADRLAMNRLCAAAVLLSRGTPFFLAGEEFLRSKNGDSNSYASSDEVNNIVWDDLTPGSEALRMSEYYRGLIAVRRENAFLRSGSTPVCELLDGNVIAVTWSTGEESTAYAVLNPGAETLELSAPEGWTDYRILLQGAQVSPEGTAASGVFRAEPCSVTLIIRNP